MSLDLPVPSNFPAFPYATPYGIQQDLMRHLYSAIEAKQVTIVESPTGTGKTLSLLCASLTWLLDNQERARKGHLSAISGGREPDWVLAQSVDRRRRLLEQADRDYEERLSKARKKENALRRMASARKKRAKAAEQPANTDELDEDEFLPEDEENPEDDDNISPAVKALMAKYHAIANTSHEEAEPTCTKIYYASRTHSQLTQTLPEMRRLKLSAATMPIDTPAQLSQTESQALGKRKPLTDDGVDTHDPLNVIRSVALGSRKQLCIHDELRQRATDLDEACRQMLNDKAKRCPHLPPIGEDNQMLDFRDQILSAPKDIEELAEVGRLSNTCPYFGSRAAISQAQLVTLPYNLLLQRSAREAIGIDLKDQVLVIDEAHNLIPTLLSLSSVHLPGTTLSISLQQLSIYYSRFRTRLSTAHGLHLKRLVAVLKELQSYGTQWMMERKAQPSGQQIRQEVVTPGELFQRLGRKVEGINLLDINQYLRSSKIARKINGYSDKLAEKVAKDDPAKLVRLRRAANPPLHIIEEFIAALSEANDDGRVTIALVGDTGREQVDFKYQLLNPATHFKQVLEDARCVVLAGGTMSPMSEYTTQLFSHVPAERLSTFSCGHIVPPENLRAVVLNRGPRGSDLEFKFGTREDPALIAELGQMLLNFTNVVPAGMVVFLPSYAFLNTVTSTWDKSGLLAKLEAKKKVFSELQGTEVEPVLREYAATIRAPHTNTGKKGGALMLAVVGAKLSEGLNFTDDLARAVVVVGIPFPNLHSPELQERMRYIKRVGASNATGDPAKELYDNMAMNAVNQSIGRAIRHGGDWAGLILIDKRYSTPRIRNKLPKWIADSLNVTDSFGGAMKELGTFYRGKR